VSIEPFVSILIPVRNEERYIERCLYSVARQDYARERIEVIVIDGMSDDATRAIVTRFAHESTLDLRLIDNPRLRPAAAMNAGIAAARGGVIVRLDGHAAFAPDYVRRCVDALDAHDADCAGGVLDSEGDTFVGGAIAVAMSSSFGVGGAAFRAGGPAGAVDTVAFGAYRRDVFDRIGLFAEDIVAGEDDEFNYRLRDAGGVIVLVPEARATYTVRGGLGPLWRQYFAYGQAKPQVLGRHPYQAQARQLVPAVFVSALGYAALRGLFGRWEAFKLLATVYAGAATLASLVLAVRRRWRHLPLLPAVFACLHVSYGLGFLVGIVGLAGGRARSARSGAREGTESPNQ
jgi:cellulose synthase/poly-beta-1,6-N-acetylglucosamine synthase-like glycosyltransferase